MVTKESEIHDAIKQRVVDAKEQDTTHILRSLRNTARVFKNKVALEVREREKHNADIKELIPLVSGTRGRKVYETGDEDAGVWTAGQTVGLIHDVVCMAIRRNTDMCTANLQGACDPHWPGGRRCDPSDGCFDLVAGQAASVNAIDRPCTERSRSTPHQAQVEGGRALGGRKRRANASTVTVLTLARPIHLCSRTHGEPSRWGMGLYCSSYAA